MPAMSSDFSLKENDDVRAGARRSRTCVSRSMRAPARPSEKYSWSLAGLKSANGNTAIDFSEPAAWAGHAGRSANGKTPLVGGLTATDRLDSSELSKRDIRSTKTWRGS